MTSLSTLVVVSAAEKGFASVSVGVLVGISFRDCAEKNSSKPELTVSLDVHAGKSNNPQSRQNRLVILFTLISIFYPPRRLDQLNQFEQGYAIDKALKIDKVTIYGIYFILKALQFGHQLAIFTNPVPDFIKDLTVLFFLMLIFYIMLIITHTKIRLSL